MSREKNISNFVFVAVEYLSDYKDDGFVNLPYDGDISNEEDRYLIMKKINEKMQKINPRLEVTLVKTSARGYFRVEWEYTV